jgi:hypothetical protein
MCGILMYDRLSGSYAPGLHAAQAPASAFRPSASDETRLQKLQHYQVASQLLQMELAKYAELRTAELREMMPVVKATFAQPLSKNLQATWDRMNNPNLEYIWKSSDANTAEGERKEEENKTFLDKEFKSFWQSLLDARSASAKEWERRFASRPVEKEIRIEAELIPLFMRERDEARAALK